MATLKTINEIIAEYEGAGPRGVGKQMHADLAQSLADVGAVFSIKNGETPTNDITLSSGWNRLDVPGLQVSGSQGVIEGPNQDPVDDQGAWVQFRKAGEGDWKSVCYLKFQSDSAGDFALRLAEVDDQGAVTTTPYEDDVTGVQIGDVVSMLIATSRRKNKLKDERLQFEIRGQSGAQTATITVLSVQIEFSRV